MKKEYFLAKDRIVFICLFIAFALIVAVRGFYLYYSSGQPAWILPGSVPLLLAIILFPVLTTRKVIITSKSIIKVGILTTKEIFFIDIDGYRLRDIPITGRKKLVLVAHSGSDDVDIRYFQLSDGDEILAFVVDKFRDLDE
jgi:hypothetical protein